MLNLLSGLVKKKTSNDTHVRTFSATENIMEGLTKMICSFPKIDQIAMTNRISQIVHEQALEIENRQEIISTLI